MKDPHRKPALSVQKRGKMVKDTESRRRKRYQKWLSDPTFIKGYIPKGGPRGKNGKSFRRGILARNQSYGNVT